MRPPYHPNEYRPDESRAPLITPYARASSTTLSHTSVTLRQPFATTTAAINNSSASTRTTILVQPPVKSLPRTATGRCSPAPTTIAANAAIAITVSAAMPRTVSRDARHPRRAARPSTIRKAPNDSFAPT